MSAIHWEWMRPVERGTVDHRRSGRRAVGRSVKHWESHRKQGFFALPYLPLLLPLVFAVAMGLSLPFAMAMAMTRIGRLGFELVPCCVLCVACCVLRVACEEIDR
jgi:hypothetical protein